MAVAPRLSGGEVPDFPRVYTAMNSGDLVAAAVGAAVVALIALIAFLSSGRARFCSGPHNIGLYDQPYTNYPSYEGRGATKWDSDRRCAAFCQNSPCTVWCR